MAYTEDEKLQIYTEATEPAPCAVHEYYRSLSLLQKIHGYRDADELYEQYAKEIARMETPDFCSGSRPCRSWCSRTGT